MNFSSWQRLRQHARSHGDKRESVDKGEFILPADYPVPVPPMRVTQREQTRPSLDLAQAIKVGVEKALKLMGQPVASGSGQPVTPGPSTSGQTPVQMNPWFNTHHGWGPGDFNWRVRRQINYDSSEDGGCDVSL